MKKISAYSLLFLFVIAASGLAGCEAIAGIFKAGVWVGILIAVIVIVVIIRLAAGKK